MLYKLMLLLWIVGCEFQSTPYGTKNPTNFVENNSKQIERLRKVKPKSDSLRIALLSDTHNFYDDFEDAITNVNQRSDIDLVVVSGDFTQFGLQKEYEWFMETIEQLKIPYVVAVGNHDAVGYGEEIYKAIFGSYNFAFTWEGFYFVVLNTNVWDFESKVPDFDWFSKTLEEAPTGSRIVSISHIAPWGDQISPEEEVIYHSLLKKHKIHASLHGHEHHFRFENHYDDEIPYILADDIGSRNYTLVELGDRVHAKQVYF